MAIYLERLLNLEFSPRLLQPVIRQLGRPSCQTVNLSRGTIQILFGKTPLGPSQDGTDAVSGNSSGLGSEHDLGKTCGSKMGDDGGFFRSGDEGG